MESIESLFLRARELRDPLERATLLDQACSGNASLRGRLEAMLVQAEQADEFFDRTKTAPRITPHPSSSEGVGDIIGGRYKLLQKIGEGGMGVVYMAEQREPVIRKVALKIIKLGMDTRQVVARFEAERQALAMMDHPNIARVLDGGTTEQGRPYFVMELVQGLPLTQFCDEAKLSMQDRLQLLLNVCSAIQHAHQKGVIHRDIKPSNILVTLHGDKPVPKVIDFGIAKATQQRLTDKTLFTEFQQFIGTPTYMSPEQASLSGLDIDTRSDIYSLGVILYEMLTGRPPFDPKELMEAGFEEMRRTIREKEPTKPSTRLHTLQGEDLTATARQRNLDAPKLIHSVRGDLDWIVMKCLEKDRSRRYESVSSLAQDLQRHLQTEPILARPPSSWYRFQKLARRNRVAFAASAAVLAALLFGLGLSTWLFILEKQAHNRALAAEQQQKELRHQADEARDGEARQRQRAESVAEQLALERVEESLANNSSTLGLAYLARAIRDNSSNRIATERLIHALQERNYAVPVLPALKHQDWTMAATFSPNGKWIATGSRDGAARIWDARTGEAETPFLPHGKRVTSVEFSPDSTLLLTASEDGSGRVWDVRLAKVLRPLLKHTNGLSHAEFSPNGAMIVTASHDKTVRVWETSSGRPLTESLRHGGGVLAAHFSPDGRKIITASRDDIVKIWDITTGVLVGEPMDHPNWAWDAHFSPDGQIVVSGHSDGVARFWDAQTGQPVGNLMRHEMIVRKVVFSPDGKLVATASMDNTARLWHVPSGLPASGPLRHLNQVFTVAFSPDSRLLISAGDDALGRIWDTATGAPVCDPFQTEGWVGHAQFSPDSKRVVVAGWSTGATVWELHRGATNTVSLLQDVPLKTLQFSGDGKHVAAVSSEKIANIWSLSARTFKTVAHKDKINSAVFSPGHDQLLTASKDGTAGFWDVATGNLLSPPLRHEGEINSARFSPDGKLVVTAGADTTAVLWDARSHKPILTPLKHGGFVNDAVFTADGKTVVTISTDEHVHVWNAETATHRFPPLRHEGYVIAVAVSPDNHRVAAVSFNVTKIWDLKTGKLLSDLGPHSWVITSINTVEFSPDGTRLVTSSYDRTARLWDVGTGKPVGEPMRHRSGIYSASFSPNGLRIVTASDDGTIRLWDAATGRALSEPLRCGTSVGGAAFNPAGDMIGAVTYDGTVNLWPVRPPPIPAPVWLAELAESVAGQRLNENRITVRVLPEEILRLRSSTKSELQTILPGW